MDTIEILYSSGEGQAKRIALQVSAQLREAGFDVQVEDVRGAVMMRRPCAIVLIASVHGGKHAPAAAEYVRDNLWLFNELPTAFMSVSLSASEPDRKVALGYIQDFIRQTGWKPDIASPIAGALRYSQYNFLKKMMIKSIASKNGLPTDTSRDHEFTNWEEVQAVVNAFIGGVRVGV